MLCPCYICIWYACHRTAPAEVPWPRQSALRQGPVAHGRAALQGFCYTCTRQFVHTMYDCIMMCTATRLRTSRRTTSQLGTRPRWEHPRRASPLTGFNRLDAFCKTRGINTTMRQELMSMNNDGLHFWWISRRPAGSRTHIPGVPWNRVWNEQSD